MASVSFSPSAGGLVAEEQHEKLRRFVDEWRGEASSTLEKVADIGFVGDIIQDPVQLLTHFCDDTTLLDLVPTEDSVFNKVVTVLAFDCIEIERLQKQAVMRFYPRLLVFGLAPNGEDVPLEGELQKSFAKSLPFFHELLEFLSELRGVIVNLVQQLEAIYTNNGARPYSSFLSCRLQTVISSLVDGFAVFLTLDEIIAQNLSIGHAMSLFTRMLHSVRTDPSGFNMAPENVEELDRAVNDMDNVLITGIFQRCMQEDFIGNSEFLKLKSNKLFLDEFVALIRDSLAQILSRLDTMQERSHDREQIAGLLALFAFHSWMTVDSVPEKKVAKLVMEVLKRTPVLHIYCNTQLISLEFLRAQLPSWTLAVPFLKEARKDAAAISRAYLTSLDDSLTRSTQNMRSALVNWLVSFDSTVSPTVQQLAIHAALGLRLKQLVQGVYFANRLQHIIQATIDCHVSLEEPMSKDQVHCLRQAAELLKAVRAVYQRRNSETVQGMSNMIELAQAQVQKHLLPLKAQLEADMAASAKASGLHLLARSFTRGKDMDSKLQDALAAVDLALEMLQGCPSLQRRTVLHICLDNLFGLSKLSEESVMEILEMSLLIDMAANIHKLVDISTDCSFLYWSREMMPTCFALLYAQTGEARSLQNVIDAFKDGIKLLKVGHAEEGVVMLYEKELEDAIINEVVMPLCRDIETDLRLHVHSAHLKGTINVNPTKVYDCSDTCKGRALEHSLSYNAKKLAVLYILSLSCLVIKVPLALVMKTGVRDLSWFLQVKPLRLETKYIHIKNRVEFYLNAAFYDHAAVALHNWKTYGEMRQLAEQKYDLELDDIHLPCQTLEQGVDVLDIMRNIHIFVASYTYNLNTQVFIERLSIAAYRKHINTISVKHVANSIRTHGTGIISTTVNFTYQFLAQKFIAFSQFLYDDHIKSRLVKQNRISKESKGSERREYPVARAQKLNHEIKKLGANESGQSYVDQFRMLIAEVGNALGFVRMVRLGGLSYCSASSGLVQEGKNISFELASKDLGMAQEAVKAGKLLDTALESQNMSVDGTSYFNILVNVFSQELQNDDNIHLKDFYFLVPALIMNAVEAILHSKAKLLKRNRNSADGLFTDDGFVLGLAYLLKVLGQDKQFDSLHWFESARKHYMAEKVRLEEGLDMDSIGSGLMGLQIWSQKLASISEEDAHNIQMAVKRVNSYLMELELIEFSFSGARIFFL